MSSAVAFALLLVTLGKLTAGWELNAYGVSSEAVMDMRRSMLGIPASPEAEEPLPELPAGYIYPVLAWGPNNQVAGMKEALVLGRLLNRTVIVHDILNHYDDKTSFNSQHQQPSSMDFGLVFNLSRLSRHQSVVTQGSLQQRGWDGRLQAVAHFGHKFLPQIKNARALNVSDEGAVYHDFERLECSPDRLAALAAALAPYTYVAFIVYENVVRDAGHGVKLWPTGDLCHDEYLRVSAQLTKSDTLVALAAAFRQDRLGGDDESFIAVHIRPYPDTCLYAWRKKHYDLKLAGRMCKNRNLFNVIVDQTVQAIKKHRLSGRLFVMSYPELRSKISEMYGEEGLEPVFYDEADLEAAVGYKSVSLLGMVEEEISYEADVFIGTSYSSMTGIIMQERYARGKAKDTTLTFTKTT